VHGAPAVQAEPLACVHAAWGSCSQPPLGKQHAPNTGHGFGVQVPNMVQVPVQSACNVTVQVPFGWQQEPEGCGQGFGVQVPNIVQVPVQLACKVTVQVPSVWQHEPVGCGH
jgi:hypothetical protein